MNEVILVTSKDSSGGFAVFDLRNGGPCQTFKNCISDPGCICLIGGSSSYSGLGSCGDFIAVSQSKKPAIHVYMWGKPQPTMQCHIQEITTALASDAQGSLLAGGSKTGRLSCWDIRSGALLTSWQGHFKAISKLEMTKCSSLLVSASEDGCVKVWNMPALLDVFTRESSINKAITPFRSYSPHTLPVKDMKVLGSHLTMRIVTCSLDRTLVVFDLFAGTECLKIVFPVSIESIACNPNEDMIFAGASNGKIFIVDLSERAISLSAAHAEIIMLGDVDDRSLGRDISPGYMTLDGHQSAVTGLATSLDNTTMVSVSMDCVMKVWDIITRQCIRESKPFIKLPLSNVLLAMRPEVLAAGVHKPTLLPMTHLKKYAEGDTQCTTIGPQLIGAFRSKDVVLDVGLELNNTNILSDVSSAKRAKTSVFQGDFIPIAFRNDSEQGQQEEEDRLDERDQKLKELKEVLEHLKDENGRWRAVCKQLKSGYNKEEG